MTPEHDAELRRRFPLVFQGPLINGEPIRCGDGWFHLLFMLCSGLQNLLAEVPFEMRWDYRAEQVKEKFGTLRFYLGRYQTLDMLRLIGLAERASATTCDVCGEPGTLGTENMLVAVRCAEHRETRPRP